MSYGSWKVFMAGKLKFHESLDFFDSSSTLSRLKRHAKMAMNIVLNLQIPDICSDGKSRHLVNCNAVPRVSNHEVVCYIAEGAFQGLEVSAVRWLHLVSAMWR